MEEPNQDITTIVGRDAVISGTLRAQGTVRIDGRVEGDVLTDGLLLIGEGAMIVGNVSAGSVVCRGMIAGDVVAAEEVALLASASLGGTVRAPVLSVEDGALVNDDLDGVPDAGEAEEHDASLSRRPVT